MLSGANDPTWNEFYAVSLIKLLVGRDRWWASLASFSRVASVILIEGGIVISKPPFGFNGGVATCIVGWIAISREFFAESWAQQWLIRIKSESNFILFEFQIFHRSEFKLRTLLILWKVDRKTICIFHKNFSW